MPTAVREGVVKPHRASHWHHDVLCHADEGELRKRIWNAHWAHDFAIGLSWGGVGVVYYHGHSRR